MKRPATLALVLALAGAAAGCAPEGTAEVAGTVRFNGRPVEEGDIVFLPADGKAPTAGKIQGGKYQAVARVGMNKVQIRAARPAAKRDPLMGATKVGYIPPKYNHKTTLSVEVRPAGTNEVAFDLKK